ncbi:hypothetical protein HOLleu_24593 [Holothuria leucospilota]|uniref:Uncharacterized protein n=1 Tax=Holothuria leucospilota TaxID=206669 RepID=A0A9Q1BRA3_HOLLE|nr:hypothetical protein HOLleu_24593 [Holothuria leucospilota]
MVLKRSKWGTEYHQLLLVNCSTPLTLNKIVSYKCMLILRPLLNELITQGK